jgi:hypothetical protein
MATKKSKKSMSDNLDLTPDSLTEAEKLAQAIRAKREGRDLRLSEIMRALEHPVRIIGEAPPRKREEPKTKKKRKMAERSRKANRKK